MIRKTFRTGAHRRRSPSPARRRTRRSEQEDQARRRRSAPSSAASPAQSSAISPAATAPARSSAPRQAQPSAAPSDAGWTSRKQELRQIEGVEVTRPSEGEISVRLTNDILFDTDSSALRGTSRHTLNELAHELPAVSGQPHHRRRSHRLDRHRRAQPAALREPRRRGGRLPDRSGRRLEQDHRLRLRRSAPEDLQRHGRRPAAEPPRRDPHPGPATGQQLAFRHPEPRRRRRISIYVT